MIDLITQYATLLAFLAIDIDTLLQINRLYKKKYSANISVVGLAVRFSATLIFLARFVVVGDKWLAFGQAIFCIILSIYLFLVIKYRKKHEDTGD